MKAGDLPLGFFRYPGLSHDESAALRGHVASGQCGCSSWVRRLIDALEACANLPRCQLGDGMHAAACPRAGYDDATKKETP